MKKANSKTALTLAIALGALFSIISAGAQAISVADTQATTGSSCVQVGSAGKLAYGEDGSIYNDAESGELSLVVDCPVFASSPKGGYVWYTDNSPRPLFCQFRSDYETGTKSEMQSSNTDDFEPKRMRFKIESMRNSYNHFRCYIPPKDENGNPSYIHGYGN